MPSSSTPSCSSLGHHHHVSLVLLLIYCLLSTAPISSSSPTTFAAAFVIPSRSRSPVSYSLRHSQFQRSRIDATANNQHSASAHRRNDDDATNNNAAGDHHITINKWFRIFLMSSKVTNLFKRARRRTTATDAAVSVVHVGDQAAAAASAINNGETDASAAEDPTPSNNNKPNRRQLPGSRVLRFILSNPSVEVKLAGMVLLSSVFVSVGTLPNLPATAHACIDFGEMILAFFFLLEYLIRWYCMGQMRLGHLLKPMVIIDFFSILPLAISMGLRLPIGSKVVEDNLLINLRLLRLMRLQRFLVDFETFERFQSAIGVKLRPSIQVRSYHLQLARVFLSFFLLWTVSAGLIYTAEHYVNPLIGNFFDAIYFSLTTLMTVGFGDIHPVTSVGKMIVCVTIIAGACIIPIQVTSFVDALLDFRKDVELKKNAGKVQPVVVDDNNELAYVYRDDDTTVQPDGSYKKIRTDTLVSCSCCGASFHRAKSTFCFSCGAPLWAMRDIPPAMMMDAAGQQPEEESPSTTSPP